MSERYKAKYAHETEYGTVVQLTCHFKFERTHWNQKHNPLFADGERPICNGCGPSGYGALVPDSILGVNVCITGDIHNWGYQFGLDHEDKAIIDETFGDNMDRLIRDAYETECRKIAGGSLVTFRLWLARRRYLARIRMAEDLYEKAVAVFGKSAFWDKRKIAFTLDEIV